MQVGALWGSQVMQRDHGGHLVRVQGVKSQKSFGLFTFGG